MSQNDEELIRRWFNEVWNERRPDVIYNLFAQDSIGHMEGAEVVGPDQFREYYSELTTIFPDLRITVEEIISQGQTVAVRWTVNATHQGRGLGLEPTNRKVSFRGMTWMHLRDGKIVDGWDSWNQEALMQQLRNK